MSDIDDPSVHDDKPDPAPVVAALPANTSSPSSIESTTTAIGTTAAPAAAGTTGSLSTALRVRGAARDIVPHLQYQLTRLGPAGVGGISALAAAAVIAGVALFSLRAANESLTARILQAQHQPRTTVTAEQGLTNVVSELPTRSQMPLVLAQLMQQAKDAGVELGKGQYTYTPPSAGAVARYEVAFPIRAPYPEVRDFVNRTLTHIPAAALHKLAIQRKVVGETDVNADVRFTIFVRDR